MRHGRGAEEKDRGWGRIETEKDEEDEGKGEGKSPVLKRFLYR